MSVEGREVEVGGDGDVFSLYGSRIHYTVVIDNF